MTSRFPPELLTEIFFHCLATDRLPIISATEAPLLLTSVCRKWRKTALDLPKLWNSLHMYFPPEISSEEIDLREEGIKEWLERSGSLTLSLSLAIDGHTARDINYPLRYPADMFTSLFEVLMSYSDRFASLQLVLDIEYFFLLDEASSDLETFPALTQFSICPPSRDTEPNREYGAGFHYEILFHKMPWLRRLSLNFGEIAATHDDFLQSQCIKWENITDLVLITGCGAIGEEKLTLGVKTLFAVLAQTPLLQSCRAEVDVELDEGFSPSETISLPYLHTMSITLTACEDSVTSEQVALIIGALAFPSLRTLDVIWTSSTIPIQQAIFSTPMEHLKHLRLKVTMMPEALAECLSLAPNLLVLEVIEENGWLPEDRIDAPALDVSDFSHTLQDSNLASLSGVSNSDFNWPLCAHLTTFRLVIHHRLNGCVSNSGLLNFLTHRRSDAAQFALLERCDLLLSKNIAPFSDADLDQLRALRDNGLKLSIRYIGAPLFSGWAPQSWAKMPILGLPLPDTLGSVEDVETRYKELGENIIQD